MQSEHMPQPPPRRSDQSPQPSPPQPQPLQIARALLIVLLVRLVILLVQGPGLDLLHWILDLTGVSSSLVFAVVGLGASVLALLGGGVWIACLVLTIVVLVRSHGRLRTGAIVVIAALAVSTLFSVDASGDLGSGIAVALRVLDLALDVLGLVTTAVAAYFLHRGHRSAVQEEGSRYALF